MPTPYFSLGMKRNKLERRRAGVVIGKAVNKSAVKRNFWRRQAKTVFAASAAPGNDFLMVAFSPINKLTKEQFHAALEKAIAAFY